MQRCSLPTARNQGADWTAARPRIPAVPPSRSGQQPAAHGLFSAASISRPRGTDVARPKRFYVTPYPQHPRTPLLLSLPTLFSPLPLRCTDLG